MAVGKGRAGKSGAPARHVVAARVRRARPPARVTAGGAGIGADPPVVLKARGMPAREPLPLGARQTKGGLSARAGQAMKSGLGTTLQGNVERMPGGASPVAGTRSGQVGGARVWGLMYSRLEQVQAVTENGHMTDENGRDEKRTRQTQIGRGWTVAGLRR
ncbi:hypothetical protein NDU88_005497 [Pleurodeles waltl]|uniref:Uncharacterized protein n=1 Tax=Pleurodeles waltl TaxID=8319 RepID=A0AAV7NMQ5_PLEWA|nr:hypothetical protein NDU88_005497 [Pleurodeles waltl]